MKSNFKITLKLSLYTMFSAYLWMLNVGYSYAADLTIDQSNSIEKEDSQQLLPELINIEYKNRNLFLEDSILYPSLRSKTPEQIDRDNQVYFSDRNEDSPPLDYAIDISADELIELAHQANRAEFHVLEEHPAFKSFVPSAALSLNDSEHQHTHNCKTEVLSALINAAHQLSKNDNLDLVDQVENILSDREQPDSIIEVLGEDWSLPLDGKIENFDTDIKSKSMDEETHLIDIDLGTKTSALFSKLSTNRNLFAPLCTGDNNFDRELVFKVPNQFDIYYRICGPRSIQQHDDENQLFSYKLGDGSSVAMKSCGRYNNSCAPTVVQMVAAELVYARRQFSANGFGVALGRGEHRTVPITLFNEPRGGSASFMGWIWINLQQAKEIPNLTERHLIHHEYFHLIQEGFGSLHSLIGYPDLWRAPRGNFGADGSIWSFKESLADLAAQVIGTGHPNYLSRFYHLAPPAFSSTYYSLPYGHLVEKFTSNTPSGNCLGCDVILDFMRNYLQPAAWRYSALTKFLKDKGFSYSDYLDLYYWELLASNYRSLPPPAKTRFSVREVTNRTNMKFLDWPPGIVDTSRPRVFNPGDVIDGDGTFFRCPTRKPLKISNAKIVNANQDQQIIGCNAILDARGAAYFHVEFDENRPPTSIIISAKPKFYPFDGRRIPVSSLPGGTKPTIKAILSSRKVSQAKLPEDLRVVSIHDGVHELKIKDIDISKSPYKPNELQFFVRDPLFLLAYYSSAMIDMEVTIQATWDKRDTDHDGIEDRLDNCPNAKNALQIDTNQNGRGDQCEDRDNDGYDDAEDNCKGVKNRHQTDVDNDSVGNLCDNCVTVPNWNQHDINKNDIGDACEVNLEINSVSVDGEKFQIDLVNDGSIPIEKWWQYRLGVKGVMTNRSSGFSFRQPVNINYSMYDIVDVTLRQQLKLNPNKIIRFPIRKNILQPLKNYNLEFTIDVTDEIAEIDESDNGFHLKSQ